MKRIQEIEKSQKGRAPARARLRLRPVVASEAELSDFTRVRFLPVLQAVACSTILTGLASCGDATRLELVRDDCPDDVAKAAPGVCGCQVPEAVCGPLASSLVHRYGFDGAGVGVVDSVGDADGTVVNTTLKGAGELDLEGGPTDQYVELPDGILSVLSSATFEAWVSRDLPKSMYWDRIFDFGVSTAGEGRGGSGESYLFLAAELSFRTAFRNTKLGMEILVDAPAPFPVGVTTHVAVVVDAQAAELRLYLNGVQQGVTELREPLSSVPDVNNWLGRSQFVADASFDGRLREFRIYAAALAEAQLATSFALGETPYFISAY